MIISIGGMQRSGTNFINYVMFLHHDLKVVNYPIPHKVKPGMNYKEIAELNFQPFPLPPGAKEIGSVFSEYHNVQESKRVFNGVCFKSDRGECWLKDVLGDLVGPRLFIFCGRPIEDLIYSWKTVYNDFTEEKFLSDLMETIESAEKLRNDSRVMFSGASIAYSMDVIRSRFGDIHSMVNLKMNHYQELFLSKRIKVNAIAGLRDRTRKELIDPFYDIEPDFDSWMERYELLWRHR